MHWTLTARSFCWFHRILCKSHPDRQKVDTIVPLDHLARNTNSCKNYLNSFALSKLKDTAFPLSNMWCNTSVLKACSFKKKFTGLPECKQLWANLDKVWDTFLRKSYLEIRLYKREVSPPTLVFPFSPHQGTGHQTSQSHEERKQQQAAKDSHGCSINCEWWFH